MPTALLQRGQGKRLAAALWAMHAAWRPSRGPLLGILGCTLLRGVLPAAFALAIRGLINAATAVAERPELGPSPLLDWVLLALAVALLDAAGTLLQQFFSERLRGDLTLALNSRVLSHAARLDLGYFERSGNREIIEHLQRDPGAKLHQYRVLVDPTPDGPRVQGIPTVISIRRGTLELFPELWDAVEQGRYRLHATLAECAGAERPARLWTDARLGLTTAQFCAARGCGQVASAAPAVLLFPRQTGRRSGLRLEALTPALTKARVAASRFGASANDRVAELGLGLAS